MYFFLVQGLLRSKSLGTSEIEDSVRKGEVG